MPRSSKTWLAVFLVFLCAGCGDPAAAVTGSVEKLCRARLEGDYSGYLEYLAGLPLQQQLQNPYSRTLFTQQADRYKKDGYLFVDLYVRDVRIDAELHQAWITFIEKWSRGTATLTFERRWQLEYVDGRWRVITL